MNIIELVPAPSDKVPFMANHRLRVSLQSGCYVLVNLDEKILYIGKSDCLSRRFEQHIDSPDKTAPTTFGRAIWFHWLPHDNTSMLERTWLNAHVVADGCLPVLNKQGGGA